VPSDSPHAEYSRRLSAIAASTAQYRKRDKVFAATKLILALLIVVFAIWLLKYHRTAIFYLAAPVLIFILLAVLHERVLRRLRDFARLQAYYERGIARIENRWAGTGETGESFLDPSHPYARDLDIFGPGGLFQLLSTARTRSGEQALASWLLTAASLDEIAARQVTAQALTLRLDSREQLVLAGEEVRAGIHPDQLIAWAEAPQSLNRRVIRITAIVLAALWILSLIAWWQWDWSATAFSMSLINFGVSFRLYARITKAAVGIDGAQHDLVLLSAILKLVENETVTATKFEQLQRRLARSGALASQAIRQLSKRVAWYESNDNWFVKLLNPFVFWTPHCVIAIEAWRARHGAAVREWLAVTGEVEALNALAVYAYEHPTDTYPQFIANGPYFEAEALAHPLLAREKSVPNDIRLNDELRLFVISGPNMAGKSTFIRSVGINAVLAQAGAPVCARRMRLSSLKVTASICILDSLQGGLSRFYAEISRLKQISELSGGDIPILFLLDELLSGTNSYDRRLGTESFLRSLLARNAIGLITTHDLALAEIAERIGSAAANYHFEDTFEDGKLHFDYKLTPGIVQTTNALLLMRSIGLDV
jgi:MutS domain V